MMFYMEIEVSTKTFRLKHKISEDAKVVMYAPTFREGSKMENDWSFLKYGV